MPAFLHRLGQDTRGATALEYGLILGLIVFAVFAGVNGMGNQLKSTFTTASTGMAAS